MPEVFEARPKKSRLILYILGCIAFIAASAWILFAPGALEHSRRSPEVVTVAGWAGLVFFTICLVAWGRMFLSSGPQIRIDQRGLVWQRWSPEPIPFTAIADSWTAKVGSSAMLCLRLHDPARYSPRNPLLRMLAGANKTMGTGDVAIPTNGLDRDIDQLAGALARWREAAAGR